MDPAKRVVTMLPMRELWNHQGVLQAHRCRDLDFRAIIDLLQTTEIQFVIADCGQPLRWIPPAERFRFWKEEALGRIVAQEKIILDDLPDGLGYVASAWGKGIDTPIVLLEAHH